jgi:hypothetical protein
VPVAVPEKPDAGTVQAAVDKILAGGVDGRMSRVPWNFGGGPMISGDVHEVILHEGSDSLANLTLERGA